MCRDKLNTSHCREIEKVLNSALSNVKLPTAISKIEIGNLTLGESAPSIQLCELCEVDPAVRQRIVDAHENDMKMTENKERSKKSDEIQIRAKIRYAGDAEFRVSTALLINFPTPAFASLPLSLRVHSCTIEGSLLLVLLGDSFFMGFEDDGSTCGPLKSLKFEADIGDKDKAVMKNTIKVQELITEQLHNVIKTKMVYPSMMKIR